MLRIITFNANGVRSAERKGFFEWFLRQDADILCLQELKAAEGNVPETLRALPGYRAWFHCASRKGYSGCGLWSRVEPLAVRMGFGDEEFDAEGRCIEADFEGLTVASVYFPSGSSSDERQQAKHRFLDRFGARMDALKGSGREVVICGDVNIAHKEIDIRNWKGNLDHSGFLPEERAWLDELFGARGWTDVFRRLDPRPERYTWWSQRGQARAKNVGWRIDYEIATPGIAALARATDIHAADRFSDHAPLIVDYDFELKGL